MSKFQIYQEKDSGEQCWCWRLLDDQDKSIGQSRKALLKGSVVPSIKKVKGEIENALIVDEVTEGKDESCYFKYFQSKENNQFYWHLKIDNEEIAVSGEGFPDEDEVKKQIQLFRKIAISCSIHWENEQDDPAYQDKHDDRTEPMGIPGS